MTGSSGLEQGYRRLLACYPRVYRREHAEEILAVLMAGAPQGQKRPRLAESADVFWSALKMRLRGPGPASENRPWADALALFSLVAPLFLLLVDILNVALPYRLRLDTRIPFFARAFGLHPEIGGLPLLSVHIFTITVGAEVVIAALVLLGLRWAALAALVGTAGYWVAAGHSMPWIPYPLQLVTTGVFIVEAAALVASPGPRRGRQLVNWRLGVMLVVVAAAVHVSTLRYDTMTFPGRLLAPQPSVATIYLAGSVVLAVAAVVLAVVWKLSPYLLLLLAAMFWPYAIQLAFVSTGGSTDLLGNPTPQHLVALYLPPVLFACWVLLTAVAPGRSRLLPS
ncbi:MAG TPA: hypothetical protein VIE45_09740 [Streptosporangiaceae bacterium]|jgi:hypothetical protein